MSSGPPPSARTLSLRALIALLLAAALVAASCADSDEGFGQARPTPDAPAADESADDDGETDQSDTDPSPAEPTPAPSPTPSPTPVPDPPGRAELDPDLTLEQGPRIAVETADGQLFTMLGDGTNQIPLTAAAEGTVNRFPTWSPDASRMAWVTTRPGGAEPEVRSARFDGSAWIQQATPSAPFLLSWDPTTTRIAALGPGPTGFELGVVDLAAAEPGYQQVDEGSPFWFSWSPDGNEFLVHASGVRLDIVPLEGSPQVLEPLPGAFQTPQWMQGPVPLVYADTVDDEDFLVVAGDQGAGRRPIATYDGYLQFTVAPSTGLIALQVLDPAVAPVPETITAAFQPDDIVDIVDPIPRDQLTLMATFGGDPIPLHPDPRFPRAEGSALAFVWSPDGNQLAWLIEVEAGSGCDTETAVYEWRFWTGSDIVDGPQFVPTPTFACNYVPFFDQFEQSVSFWSPDSAQIVYAGTDVDSGDRGIFTHQIGSVLPPLRLTDGELGVWSPDAAGSAATSAL